ARAADHRLLVVLHEKARAGLVGFLAQALEEGEHAAKPRRAVEKDLLVLLGERAEGAVHRDSVLLGDRLQLGHEVGAPGVRPGIERALEERLAGIGDHPAQREGQDVSEASALGAGAVGAIEGEELRERLQELAPAALAGPAVVIAEEVPVRMLDEDPTVSLAPRDLEALAQARPVVRSGGETIHVDLDRSLRRPTDPLVEARPGGALGASS